MDRDWHWFCFFFCFFGTISETNASLQYGKLNNYHFSFSFTIGYCGNPWKFWKTIKALPKNTPSSLPTQVSQDFVTFSNKSEICDIFNKYFVAAGHISQCSVPYVLASRANISTNTGVQSFYRRHFASFLVFFFVEILWSPLVLAISTLLTNVAPVAVDVLLHKS